VELAGALKNVIAIGAGFFGTSSLVSIEIYILNNSYLLIMY